MKNVIKILLVLVILHAGACKKLTEPGLDNQFTRERVLEDPAFAEGILLRAYRLLPTDYAMEEVATDDAVSNDRANVFMRMAKGEWSSQFNPLNIWDNSYDAIFNLNYFLSVADQVEWSWQSGKRDTLFLKRFTGEALALRAYYHFQLLRNYGGVASDGRLLGVPIVTKVIGAQDDWKLPRNTYQECIDQINKDLDASIAMLPATWVNGTDGDYNRTFGQQNQNRVNATIARALKARVALHAASPAFNPTGQTSLYVTAATIAGQLVKEKGGVAGLPPDGHKFYDADNDISNPEIIWRNDFVTNNVREVQNFPPSSWGNGRVNPTQNLVDAFPMKNGMPITATGSGYLATAPYTNRDPRLAAYVIYNGNKIGSKTVNTDVNTPVDGLNKTPDFSTRTGYYLLKLLRPDVNLNPNSVSTRRHFYTHVRYTELYLIYAEAANEAWGPDADPNGFGFTARQLIGAIRKRAGITQPDAFLATLTTKDAFRELIRNERRLELSFEGFRFWDLRRWKVNLTETAKGVSIDNTSHNYIDVETRVFPARAVYGPIPLSEILKYDGLLQNKEW